MRSLFSGVSGLKVHQTKMDVIGNNISNVNTVGFKSSTVNFSDILYQTTQSSTGPNPTSGSAGMNAKQIGLGSNLASITTNMKTSGGSQRTDNPLDVMIQGDAFFIVNNGGVNYFTKAGAFNIDANGTLCTATGATVMGWQVDPTTQEVKKDLVSALKVMSPENLYADPAATTDAYLKGNIDKNDPQLTSDGVKVQVNFYDKMGNKFGAQLLIKHNTEEEEATNIYSVTVADVIDSEGNSVFVKKVVDADTGDITYEANDAYSFTFGTETYDAPGEVDASTGKFTFDDPPAISLTFNPATGKFVSIGEADGDTPPTSIPIQLIASDEEGQNPFEIVNLDFSSLTQYGGSGTSNIEPKMGSLKDGTGAGNPMGDMTEVSIDQTGKIFGSYSNGNQKLLGQIAVTSFANPSGLEAVGNNMFSETQNSGTFDGIGKDPTVGGGKLSTGVLEMSNVDLSSEFTSMITTQRGFQANSRIITTSDTLLEELINLKR